MLCLNSEDEVIKKETHSSKVDSHIRKDMPPSLISKLFFSCGNIYFFIGHKISLIENKRTLNILMNVLIQEYINLLKNRNVINNLLVNDSLIPINLNCDKDNNISLVSVVFFLDFLCVILDNSNVDLNGDDSFLNNIVNYMDENRDPFENYDGEVFINWIYDRMERNNMLFNYDINRILSNKKESKV